MKKYTLMDCAAVAAVFFVLGNVRGHMKCLGKVKDKYGDIIEDEKITVPIGKKCSIAIVNDKPAEVKAEVSEENAD